MKRGIALFNAGRFAEAARRFERALRADRADTGARRFLAHAYSCAGQRAKALRTLLDAPDAGSPLLLSTLGQILNQMGRYEEAARCLKRAAAGTPRTSRHWAQLGEMSFKRGRLDEAEAHLLRALRLGTASCEDHLLLGRVLEKQGRPKDAQIHYRRALRLAPSSFDVRLCMGEFLLRHGRTRGAQTQLRRAAGLNPGSLKAGLLLAHALEKSGRTRGAQAAYRRAVAAHPKTFEAHASLAKFLLERGRAVEAESVLRKAVKLAGCGPEGLVLLGRALRAAGHTHETAGRDSEARRSYLEALRLDPGSDEAHLRLGAIYGKEGNTGAAEKHLLAALRAAPGSFEIHLTLGDFHMKRGDLRKAESLLRRAVSLDGGAARGHLLYGNVLESLGRLPEAKAAYREALRRASPGSDTSVRLLHACEQHGWLKESDRLMREIAAAQTASEEVCLAAADFFKGRARFVDAARALRAGARKYPNAAVFHFKLGWLYQQNGERARMRASFRHFLSFRDGGASEKFRRFAALLALGEYAKAFLEGERILDEPDDASFERLLWPWADNWLTPQPEGFYARHLQRLDRLSAKHGGSPWFIYCRALLLLKLKGRKNEGIAELDRLKERPNKRYGWMRHLRGWALLLEGRPREALPEFRAALRSMPGLFVARGNLAEALLCLGKYEQAFKEMEEGESKLHDKHGKLFSELRGWRGEMNLWIGRYKEAIRDLNWAVSRGNWLAVCWRGAAHMLTGKPQQALADLDRAIVPGSQDAEAFVWRGELKRNMGDLAGSLKDLDRAIELQPGTWATVNRALTRRALGDETGAQKDLQTLPEEISRDLTAALKDARGIRRHEPYFKLLMATLRR